MDSEQGCSGCLSVIATLFSIGASAVTIIGYFSNSDSLLDALSEWWSGTFLEDVLPGAAGFFGDLATSVNDFAESWPMGPLLSALLLFLIIAVLRFLVEKLFEPMTVDVTFADVFLQAFFYLPLALLWVWTFSGVTSTLGLIVFLGGYLVSIVGSIMLAAEFGW